MSGSTPLGAGVGAVVDEQTNQSPKPIPGQSPGPDATPAHEAAAQSWNSGLGTTTKLKVLFSDAGRLHTLPHGPRAVIVGAGVAGLSAAAGLHRAGWRVGLYEQDKAPDHDAAQMGLALSAAAVSSLRAIGADVGILAAGEPIRKRRVLLSTGRILRETSAADEELRYGVPGVMLTRADLLGALRALVEPELIHSQHTFTGMQEEAVDVAATLDKPDGQPATMRADAIIGADGAHSRVRAVRSTAQSPDPLRWQIIYGIAEAPISLYPAGMLSRVWGQGTRMGIYRILPRRREIASPHRVAWWLAREVWSDDTRGPDAPALRQHALAMTEGWWSVARELILATPDESFRAVSATTDVHAAQHSACSGRLTLLGDAAHPLWPIVDDGAAMAVRDGMQLTAILAESRPSDVAAALRAFEARRDVHVRTAIRRARLLAPLRSTLLSSLRAGLIRVIPRGVVAGSLEAHG